jgi:hypothetical protein
MTQLPPDMIARGFAMETTRHRDELRSSLREAFTGIGRVRADVDAGREPNTADLRNALVNLNEAYGRAMALNAVTTTARLTQPDTD